MFPSDLIGNLGEWIVAVAFTLPAAGRYGRPLFRPVFLGEKYPTADLLVDILDDDGQAIGFFFVQVRARTESPIALGRLPVKLEHERYDRLLRLPIPAYLVGVDVTHENAYVIAAFKPRKTGISSMTTAFSLKDANVKVQLYEEVLEFWQRRPKRRARTRFNDD